MRQPYSVVISEFRGWLTQFPAEFIFRKIGRKFRQPPSFALPEPKAAIHTWQCNEFSVLFLVVPFTALPQVRILFESSLLGWAVTT